MNALIRSVPVIALLLTSCGSPTVLEARDYDQSCERGSECVAVFLGDVCNPCRCNNAAIVATQAEIFEADATSARRSCGRVEPVECAPCESRTVVCESQKCALSAP